jgi:hypothetical protein
VLLDTQSPGDGVEVLVELCWRAAFRPPRRLKDATLVVTEREVP